MLWIPMVKCDYCGKPAELVSGKKIYPHRKDLYDLEFWECEPCGAYTGCHKNSRSIPMGRLADAELRKAKKKAHSYFDPTWNDGSRNRKDAYSWLANKLGITPGKCHIGFFDIDTCKRVVEVCNEYYSVLNNEEI